MAEAPLEPTLPRGRQPVSTRKEVERILGVWTERLALQHWRMLVDWRENHHCVASVLPHGPYETSTLVFNASTGTDNDLLCTSRTYVNEVVVHELLHVLRTPADMVMERLEVWMPPAVFKSEESRHDADIECYVDHMARVLIRLGGVV